MKRIKKFASLTLALVMAMAMTFTAFAADNNPHTITVEQNTDDKTVHQYAAYQIFAGDLAKVDDFVDTEEWEENGINKDRYVLSNIIWGSGVDGAALLADLIADKEEVFSGAFVGCKTAADVAAVLGEFSDTSKEESGALDSFARAAEKHLTGAYESVSGSGNVEIKVPGSGYYLVRDITDSVEPTGAYTRALLRVVGDSTMVVKSEVPSGDKKVYVNADTSEDANNASIGSHVSYEITSKVPNYAGYNYYYFIMNDTLSPGLTFDGADSVEVKIGDSTLTQGTFNDDGTVAVNGDYYIYIGEAAKVNGVQKTFRLAFANIMNYTPGADIVVTYSATVNDKAVVGTTGNPNTWTLQYSNKPDDTFDGERLDGQNTPGLPLNEDNEPLGETPEEKTLTYVTELDITKYADEVAPDHVLEGAVFTLSGTSYQVVLSNVEYFRPATADDTNREARYYLLTDGTYTAEAPSDASYKEIGVGTEETTTGYIKDADGNYIIPQNKEDYIGETLYKLVNGNSSNYADPNTTYVRDYVEKISYEPVKVSIQMTTDSDGKLYFKGLGAGEYRLEETVTPAGYNTLAPVTITIGFKAPDKEVTDGTETCTWTMTSSDPDTVKIDEVGTSGIFATNVINQSGSLLPSTGGIGTTVFYVVGAILVIGAGILLVTKKRMSAR